MHLDVLEMSMEPEPTTQLGTYVATVAGGIVVLVGIIVRGWSALKRSSQQDTTDADTLKLLQAAVDHWKTLYDAAWAQVKKERELREVAEARTQGITAEVEELRKQVATLERKIDMLQATFPHSRR